MFFGSQFLHSCRECLAECRSYISAFCYLAGLGTPGTWGERLAARCLLRKGHYIWHRNWRCAAGELDLITIYGRTLIINEVKTRSIDLAHQFTLSESIDEEKTKKLAIAGSWFIARHRLAIKRLRILKIKYERIGIYYNRKFGLLRPVGIEYQDI